MKLDAKYLKYLSKDQLRVLISIELGMRNHELVPTALIERIANLKYGGVRKLLGTLAKKKLIHHDSLPFDGYKLTYLGYDYLALSTFLHRGVVDSIGRQIGVGKESDIFVVALEEEERILKTHRLGRVSFKTIKNNRDYLGKRKKTSWLYMSRLAALKEYAFMKALYDVGYPVPQPLDQNRHCILMEIVDGYPLYQISKMENPEIVGMKCLQLIVRLAEHGLIHGDFNEFNLLVKENEDVIVIDFPQMLSTHHENAEMYFDRDVQCIHTYFAKRYGVALEYFPKLSEIVRKVKLDEAVSASGFSKEKATEFENLTELLDIDVSGAGKIKSQRQEADKDESLEEIAQSEPIEAELNEVPTNQSKVEVKKEKINDDPTNELSEVKKEKINDDPTNELSDKPIDEPTISELPNELLDYSDEDAIAKLAEKVENSVLQLDQETEQKIRTRVKSKHQKKKLLDQTKRNAKKFARKGNRKYRSDKTKTKASFYGM